jgi:hypothetical protein
MALDARKNFSNSLGDGQLRVRKNRSDDIFPHQNRDRQPSREGNFFKIEADKDIYVNLGKLLGKNPKPGSIDLDLNMGDALCPRWQLVHN